jgi:uncharacterized protein (DUF2147 family)
MNLQLRILCLGIAMLGCTPVSSAMAGDPTGIWLTEKGDARVRIAHCGDALCGAIVWLVSSHDPASGKPWTDEHNPVAQMRSRPLLGIHVAYGMRPSGTPDKWTGHFYNADDGQTYDGHLVLQNATTLRAEGCMLGLCSGETWSRVR